LPTTFTEPPGFVANTAPTGSVTISGTNTPGRTLTAANTLADAEGLGTISYQWQSSTNGTSWTDLSAGSSLLVNGAAGQLIRVVASYTDGLGTAELAASHSSCIQIAMSTSAATVLRVNQALYGAAPGYTTFQSQTNTVTGSGDTGYVTSLASQDQFTIMTDAQFSHLLIVHCGLTAFGAGNTLDLETALTYYITYNEAGAANTAPVRGVIAMQLSALLSGLEQATGIQDVYRDAAVAFNSQMNTAYTYSNDSSHLSSPSNVQLVGVAQTGPVA